MTELTREENGPPISEAKALRYKLQMALATEEERETNDDWGLSDKELYGRALEALNQREQGGWQDLSSAPMDGSKFFAHMMRGDITIARWCSPYMPGGDDLCFCDENRYPIAINGWLPTPSAKETE